MADDDESDIWEVGSQWVQKNFNVEYKSFHLSKDFMRDTITVGRGNILCKVHILWEGHKFVVMSQLRGRFRGFFWKPEL